MTKIEKIQFWMVWREGSPTTRFRHPAKSLAVKEANRLAKQNPGECFYVLKATAGVVATAPEIATVRFIEDPIPF